MKISALSAFSVMSFCSELNNPLCSFVSFMVFVISESALTVSPICG